MHPTSNDADADGGVQKTGVPTDERTDHVWAASSNKELSKGKGEVRGASCEGS